MTGPPFLSTHARARYRARGPRDVPADRALAEAFAVDTEQVDAEALYHPPSGLLFVGDALTVVTVVRAHTSALETDLAVCEWCGHHRPPAADECPWCEPDPYRDFTPVMGKPTPDRRPES